MIITDLLLNDNEYWIALILFIFITLFIFISYFIFNTGIISSELNRRIIHILIGIMMSFSPLIFTTKELPALIAVIFSIVNTIAFDTKLFSSIHSQKRKSYGTIYFPIAFFIMTWLFWDYSDFIIISLLILTFADPLASQIGSSIKSPKMFKVWHDEKSIEGTVTFFIVTIIILFFGSRILLSYTGLHLIGFIIVTTVFTTIAEITSKEGTDNLSIPLVSILIMIGYNNSISEESLYLNNTIINSDFLSIIFISIFLFIAYHFKSLSLSGYFGSLIMGAIIIFYGSVFNLILLAVFFVFSSSLGKLIKDHSFKAPSPSNRNITQVFCNGGIALIICIYDFFIFDFNYLYMFTASIAAAMSDTWGTEFGKLSKSKPISIITGKTINHGLSGGITQIGTLGSLLGSCIIGFTLWILLPISDILIYGVIISGFLAAIFDSILGGTIQGKFITPEGNILEIETKNSSLISGYRLINNNVVNFIATLSGPIIMTAYTMIIGNIL